MQAAKLTGSRTKLNAVVRSTPTRTCPLFCKAMSTRIYNISNDRRQSRWYHALNRQQWYTLLAANLGWVFDGYETYALILTMPATFQQLLEPQQFAAIPFYAGVTIAVTLLAWGIGGIIGGILADYIGRKRTLLYAIFAYSLTTGLTGLALNCSPFLVLRFVVGLALG